MSYAASKQAEHLARASTAAELDRDSIHMSVPSLWREESRDEGSITAVRGGKASQHR